MVMRPSVCSRLRILRSIASREAIGMNPLPYERYWEFIPIFAGMLPKFEIFGDPDGIRIGQSMIRKSVERFSEMIMLKTKSHRRNCRHGNRSRTPGNADRAESQGAVAVLVDHSSRQPYPAQHRWLEGRRPSGLVRLARQHHVGALFLGAAPAGSRRGEAACEPGVSRHPVSVRAPDPRQAGEFSRLQGRAVLSLAYQGC